MNRGTSDPLATKKRWGMRLLPAILTATLLLAGAAQFGQGVYILAKAELAQYLIKRAWDKNQLAGRIESKPWAWADTSPVAHLNFVRQRISMVVLSGDSGRILAFGPGHNPNTPMPGTGGNAVVSGHRDTHFSVLKTVKPGDLITAQNINNEMAYFEVQNIRVVDKSQVEITGDNGVDELTLVTCWPFDAVALDGPERLVVSARRVAGPIRPGSKTRLSGSGAPITRNQV